MFLGIRKNAAYFSLVVRKPDFGGSVVDSLFIVASFLGLCVICLFCYAIICSTVVSKMRIKQVFLYFLKTSKNDVFTTTRICQFIVTVN